MGKYYYVNTKAGSAGVYRVHTAHCPSLPSLNDRFFLGTFYAPLDAIKQARKYYAYAEGCKTCCPQRKNKEKIIKNQSVTTIMPSC
ncbi:hypothetical protein COO59_03805 [Mixta theicola]|uniref:Uncharacterized protein n=1 Tax=Mixta theicola TaxID=1458355 RepID=A0A2K1QDF4_9GAMM|nr:hypothetical protein [Mixta theicola]PNS13048.1 hypothetical protein COO59_03805 [Mixta theicola]GLR09310.1 hypothetical protein GCM10007905_20300 [Mixta theicola]